MIILHVYMGVKKNIIITMIVLQQIKTMSQLDLPPIEIGLMISEYLSAKDLYNVRGIPQLSGFFVGFNRPEKILNECSVANDSISDRIELEAEKKHGQCLGSIYRLYDEYRAQILFNLPYDDLKEMKKFMEISGVSANDILKYATTLNTFTSISYDVFEYLLSKNTSDLPSNVALIYFRYNNDSPEKLADFIKSSGVHMHDHDLVELVRMIIEDEKLLELLLKVGDKEVPEVIFHISLVEEKSEVIDMVIPYLTPEILEKSFDIAHIKYHEENPAREAIKNAYEGSEYADLLEKKPNYNPE